MAASLAFLACITLAGALTLKQQDMLTGNPIRKVVTVLQDMQKTVALEGEKEKALFDKFMCYCNNGASSLDSAIQASTSQVESLTAATATHAAQKSQLAQDAKQHGIDLAAAENAVKESRAMREKQANEFAASSGESKANIASMANALDALKKGMTASLLQTAAGQTLRNVIQHSPAISDIARSTLVSFLETGEGGSDQIIGVVEQMKETMESDLKQFTADEEEAKTSFASLVDSKDGEIGAAKKAIETKTARVGELSVAVAQGSADLENTQAALADDEEFKAHLSAGCSTKSSEWDARSNLRAQEIQAISETIEMLSGDDALDLFKKTLPSSTSLLQLATTTRTQQQQAAALLRKLLARNPSQAMNLRSMLIMLNSRSGGFTSVVKMIDGMIEMSKKEQAADDHKRDFCLAEIAKTKSQVQERKGDIADIEADIEKKEDIVASFASEIAAVQKGMEDLDKSVVQATDQRKNEHAEYTATAASNSAAKDLLGMAKNRMNKFYQPSLYKAPPTTTLSDSPYGFVQLSLRIRAELGSAPNTFTGLYQKSAGATNVIGMMDQIMDDVDKDVATAKHDEALSQKDYEVAMKDAATKRTMDTKVMVEKQGAKADAQVNLQSVRADHGTQRDQLKIAKDQLYALEVDCHDLLVNYDERKKNRADEDDMLKQSEAVLQGAAAGFLQK